MSGAVDSHPGDRLREERDSSLVEQLRRPLGSLPEPDRAFIDTLLGETLDKTIIADRIRDRFQTRRKEG